MSRDSDGLARRGRLFCLVILGMAGSALHAQIPARPVPVLINPPFQFTGESEPGVPFPLPQSVDPQGRRKEVGGSNALAVSWDGKLLMYWDTESHPPYFQNLWANRPTGTVNRGFVFTTFHKEEVGLDVDDRPVFGPTCFGTPFPRFAEISRTLAPGSHPGNTYPAIPADGYTDYYPYIVPNPGSKVGSMGELGLLLTNLLSNIMYPVPDSELPAGANGANPYASDVTGAPMVGGSYLTYDMVVTLQDIPKFWDPSANPAQWKAYNNSGFFTTYETGLYPNGVNVTSSNTTEKRNGRAKLRVIVDFANKQIIDVIVLDKWQPFIVKDSSWTTTSTLKVGLSIPSSTEMYADNFEPTLTLDGHLMVAKGSDRIVAFGNGGSRVVFYYNQTAFGTTDWQGPWDLHHLYLHRNTVVDGKTLAERYPLARQPIKDYDGAIHGDGNGDGILTQTEADQVPFEGGYTWLSHDGRFVVYTVASGGVGDDHPWVGNYPFGNGILADGGGSSNRAQVSIVGSVTGWQMWKIDHAAANPSRHYFTAFDQQSRTVNLRTASFGFGPGFWDLLRGANGIPLKRDDNVKLQLVNSNRLLYYEVDLQPYQKRDYGFYLPLTVMLDLVGTGSVDDIRRELDMTRTPDLSGNANVGHLPATGSGQFPCEYFDLPSLINSGGMPGLYNGANNPSNIHPSWTSADTITDPGTGKHWAPLADWVDGVDIDDDGIIDTTAHAGRGNPRDMDSDDCWGRVGQAMFFRDETEIYVENDGTAPELNPGTGLAGSSDEFSVSLWVNPIQNRTTAAPIFDHHMHIELRKGATQGGQHQGRIAVRVDEPGGSIQWLTSTDTAAPLFDWTHVVASWKDTPNVNESELRLYVDGVEVPNSPLVLGFDQLATNTQNIRIGCLATCSTTTDRAVLLLDEVALENSAVTAQDAADLALIPRATPSWDNSNLPEPPPAPFVNASDAKVPTDNPYDANVARLGADLFNDVRLSANQTTSCASCHDPANAFTDGLTTGVGFTGTVLRRNTPSIYNQRFNTRQFWDARAEDLEDQALDPVFNADEMGLDWPTLEAYLEGDADYLARFDAYLNTNGDIEEDDVRKAIATYMRSPVIGDSAVDQFVAGDLGALTTSEIRGQALFFGKARCNGCHNGKNLTDNRLWTTGTFRSDGTDDGAFEAGAAPGTAGRPKFLGSFKTPTLRELARTGPYFHDGSASTLAAVIDFYDAGGVRAAGGYPLLDPNPDTPDFEYHVKGEEINRPLGLTAGEKADLEAYLLALTSEDVDDGAVGFDTAPTATISTRVVSSGGSPAIYSVNLIVEIIDTDTGGDLDPTNMPWTLEVEVGSASYDWSGGTVTAITNGYRWVRNFSALPMGATIRARGADWHGLWSAWDNL
ncbi:MAG: hypothetical protein KDC38_00060 [Planctomycetes bacterium]|nr:hypothetical protein [Planctomycetota bacterium]